MADFTYADAWDYVVNLGREVPVDPNDVRENVINALHNFKDEYRSDIEATEEELDAAEELHQKLGLNGEELTNFITGPLIPAFLYEHGIEDDNAIGSARAFFKFGVQVGAAYLRENQGSLTAMLDNIVEEPPSD